MPSNIFRSLGLTPELADIAETESRTPPTEGGGGSGSALEATFERLTSAGAITTTGFTVLDRNASTIFTLADGEENGQEVHIKNGAALGNNNACTIRCNFYLAHTSSYDNVNRAVIITESHAFVRLKWIEDVVTSSGTRDLWVVVGGSPAGASNPVARMSFNDGQTPS